MTLRLLTSVRTWIGVSAALTLAVTLGVVPELGRSEAEAASVQAVAVAASQAKAKKARNQKLVSRQVSNPASRLSGSWGIYKGPGDQAWKYYSKASSAEQDRLQWFMDQPKAGWYGSWVATSNVEQTFKRYIETSQAGDPNALVQITVFRMNPWYTASKHKKPTKKQIADYKKWIRLSARAIGDTRTALFLQPDSTFLRTVPDFKLSSSLIRYAAKEYGKLPNTLVYLETGGHDWPHPGQGGVKEAVRLLDAQGMKYADGVVTNTTHYNKTAWDVRRVAAISKAFAKKGKKGVKGVVNTSSNGKGFEYGKYKGADPDHAKACASKALKGNCVTLGIPPTTDVANPAWGMKAKDRRLAQKYVDAYMWVGRPWLYRQSSPFVPGRALQMVRTTPYR